MHALDRPRKLLIYLDQNFISDMAKLGRNSNVRTEFQRLFDLIHRGFLDEKCVVLRSVFHDIETSLSGSLKDPIRGRQSTLGHVRLEHPLHIKERQVTRAIHKHFARPNASETINFDDPFEDWPDDRVPHLDIDVNTDWQHAGAKKERIELAGKLDGVRKRIHYQGVSYGDQYAIELDWVRQDLVRPPNALRFAAMADVTVLEFEEFVACDSFAQIR